MNTMTFVHTLVLIYLWLRVSIKSIPIVYELGFEGNSNLVLRYQNNSIKYQACNNLFYYDEKTLFKGTQSQKITPPPPPHFFRES